MEVCGVHDALLMEPKQDGVLEKHQRRFQHFTTVPDTPDSFINERALAEEAVAVSFKALGVSGFACSGAPGSLYAQIGIDCDGIAAAAGEAIAAKPAKPVQAEKAMPAKKTKKKTKKKAAKKSKKKVAKKKAKKAAKKKAKKKSRR